MRGGRAAETDQERADAAARTERRRACPGSAFERAENKNETQVPRVK